MTEESTTFAVPKRTLTIEFFVGLFALLGVGCLAYLAVGVAGMKLFDTGTYEITAEFSNISGLELGAPVEIGGVQVGEVKDIYLKGTMANVVLAIHDSVSLRDDDNASIRTKGIIGDRYVRISPGSSKTMLSAGGEIGDTDSTLDIEEVIGKLIHRME